jgi:hypothetical protein
MKKSFFALLPVCIMLSTVLPGCKDKAFPAIHILRVEGIAWACNVTTSYATFGTTTEFEGQNEVYVAASEGDLLYMMNSEDLEVYYRYNSGDGKDLAFTFDTLGLVSVYLNGELNYLELSGSSSSEAWEALSELEISQLSTLSIRGPIDEDLIARLEPFESQLQGMGLVLENSSGPSGLGDLLDLCQPEFLMLDGSWELPEEYDPSLWKRLELLCIPGDEPMLSKLIQYCPNLESLIISDWKPLPGELLTLAPLKKLCNLTLAESELTSLQNMEFPESLLSLNLITCDTLSDVALLSMVPELCRLNLTGCNKIQETGTLKNLKNLRWFSFPPHISQQEFEEISYSLPELEMVELIACQNIEDYTPLKQLDHLRILSLQLDNESYKGLDSLKQLELLILSTYVFDNNPEWISELRASLPDANVVPGSGICLGSGWLLLLLPLILLFRFTFHRKTSSGVS